MPDTEQNIIYFERDIRNDIKKKYGKPCKKYCSCLTIYSNTNKGYYFCYSCKNWFKLGDIKENYDKSTKYFNRLILLFGSDENVVNTNI